MPDTDGQESDNCLSKGSHQSAGVQSLSAAFIRASHHIPRRSTFRFGCTNEMSKLSPEIVNSIYPVIQRLLGGGSCEDTNWTNQIPGVTAHRLAKFAGWVPFYAMAFPIYLLFGREALVCSFLGHTLLITPPSPIFSAEPVV